MPNTNTFPTLRRKKLALVGYGNQGRAHALNLRDQGVPFTLCLRAEGASWKRAQADGFCPHPLGSSATHGNVFFLLVSDEQIPAVWDTLHAQEGGASAFLTSQPWFGFAHGYALHFQTVPRSPQAGYFLCSPRAPGYRVRQSFLEQKGFAVALASEGAWGDELNSYATEYAEAIGACDIVKTTFQAETESNLFAEQTVLCGVLPRLLTLAHAVAVEKGLDPTLASYDCIHQVRYLLELFETRSLHDFYSAVSPTAAYGGLTRGKRLLPDACTQEMRRILEEIRSGTFAQELVQNGDTRTRHNLVSELAKQEPNGRNPRFPHSEAKRGNGRHGGENGDTTVEKNTCV